MAPRAARKAGFRRPASSGRRPSRFVPSITVRQRSKTGPPRSGRNRRRPRWLTSACRPSSSPASVTMRATSSGIETSAQIGCACTAPAASASAGASRSTITTRHPSSEEQPAWWPDRMPRAAPVLTSAVFIPQTLAASLATMASPIWAVLTGVTPSAPSRSAVRTPRRPRNRVHRRLQPLGPSDPRSKE